MAKKHVEQIESVMGVLASLITLLVRFVKKSGGTAEDIRRLVTPEGEGTLQAIGKVIARHWDDVEPPTQILCTGFRAEVMGEFQVYLTSGKLKDVIRGHGYSEIDEELDYEGCTKHYEGSGSHRVVVLWFGDEKMPIYGELPKILLELGYRKATDLELVCLGAQNFEKVYELARSNYIVNGQDTDIELRVGDKGLRLVYMIYPDCNEEVEGFIAVVKLE